MFILRIQFILQIFFHSYIGVFVFVPVILKENFNQFIKEVLEVTSEFVADEEEKVREIALRVLRILI